MKTKNLVLASLFAAIVAILSIVTIPLPTPVPFTLQTFAIALTGGLLGSYLGATAIIIYVLLGAIGLPVFSGMTGGIQVLVGPTGGYIFGFIIAAFIIGLGMEYIVHKQSNAGIKLVTLFLTMFVGLIMIYIVGTIQLRFVTGLSWAKAFAAGVAPFFVLDVAKIMLSTIVVHAVYPALTKANLVSRY